MSVKDAVLSVAVDANTGKLVGVGTVGTGGATALEYMPTIIGIACSLLGGALTAYLFYLHKKKSKQEKELTELNKKLAIEAREEEKKLNKIKIKREEIALKKEVEDQIKRQSELNEKHLKLNNVGLQYSDGKLNNGNNLQRVNRRVGKHSYRKR